MPKKEKKEKKNKTSIKNKNKNKNLLNVKININSNNKKKVLSKKGNEKPPPSTSGPIVISHAPQPYIQQPASNPHLLDGMTNNNYGIGINKRLDGLDGGLTRIYENMVGIKEEQRLQELAKQAFLNRFDELQAEMKQQAAAALPPKSAGYVPSSGSLLSSKTSVASLGASASVAPSKSKTSKTSTLVDPVSVGAPLTPTNDFENVMASVIKSHRKAPETDAPEADETPIRLNYKVPLFVDEQSPEYIIDRHENNSPTYGDLYQSPSHNYFVNNPLNEVVNDAINEEVQQSAVEETPETPQKALLVRSTPLYGSSKNISNPDEGSSADETIEGKEVNVRSLIKRYEKTDDDFNTFEKPYDPRRSTRNGPADMSKTPKLKHQEAIKRLNLAFNYYKKDLQAEGFKKFADKLINNNDIEVNAYYEWEQKKDPDWEKQNEDTDFVEAKWLTKKGKEEKGKEEEEGKGPREAPVSEDMPKVKNKKKRKSLKTQEKERKEFFDRLLQK